MGKAERWWAALVVLAAGEPLLEHLYLKYDCQPVDLQPTFSPTVTEYQAMLDWKMSRFAVRAKAQGDAVINNIFLCPRDGDCLKEQQQVALLAFPEAVPVDEGQIVLFAFDVMEAGVARTYTVEVGRQRGNETVLRQLVVDGGKLDPPWDAKISKYKVALSQSYDVASVTAELGDGGQNMFATLSELTGRRLEEDATQPGRRLQTGEFQYPRKDYVFPIPLASVRAVDIRITSADGSQRGYYALIITREGCPEQRNIFDPVSRECVRFCPKGFFSNDIVARCERCKPGCVNCVGYRQCVQCPPDNRQYRFDLPVYNNGTCTRSARPFWEQHPEQTVAGCISAFCVLLFLAGMLGFACSSTAQRPGVKLMALRPGAGAVGGTSSDESDTSDEEDPRWRGASGYAGY